MNELKTLTQFIEHSLFYNIIDGAYNISDSINDTFKYLYKQKKTGPSLSRLSYDRIKGLLRFNNPHLIE
jgi:hypothetical protein